MKAKQKTSFLIKDPREPRRLAALRTLAAKQAAGGGGARQPSREEVIDLALAMAREEHDHHEIGKELAELFSWPAGATPCQDHRRLFLPIVEEFMKKARESLRQHYQYYHALELRRQRWLRAHPRPRDWAWTQKPLKHAVPPPRGRPYRPPEPDRHPCILSPPTSETGATSVKRPGWRETEGLLWYAWLFDK